MTKSPCTAVCTLDQNDVCLGCHRTAKEITQWSQMSEEQKQTVMDRINDQLA